MIQKYAPQKELYKARMDVKACKGLFPNVITATTKYFSFESMITAEKAEEIFTIGEHGEVNILPPGQMF